MNEIENSANRIVKHIRKMTKADQTTFVVAWSKNNDYFSVKDKITSGVVFREVKVPSSSVKREIERILST